jgi:hypothetical protein
MRYLVSERQAGAIKLMSKPKKGRRRLSSSSVKIS